MKSHRMITFGRIVKTGVVNFFRNAWLAMAAIAVMVVTLTIVLFSWLTSETFNHTIEQITERIDISVYIADAATEEQINGLISGLEQLPNVESLEYYDKEAALERYMEQNADNPQLLQAITQTDNPLPATIQIVPVDLDRIEEIRTYLDGPDIKALQSDPPSYSGDRKEAIDKISHATNILQRAGLVAVIVFGIVSMLIIFNTIQMAIFNRRDELSIMRLLGATTTYIRGPFVVEAIMYGVISAILSIAFIYMMFAVSSSTLQASSLGLLDISYSNQYFNDHFWLLLATQLGVGILIGAVSAIIATKRYLKFKAK
jgi:cell division transport system permease protein